MNGSSECMLDEKRRRLSSEYENRQIDEKRRGMVCRDFLRNSCKRGSICKFQHPEISPQKPLYSFCHDFQNGECRRSSFCKFIHSSHEDELHYINTGKLPPHLSDRYEKESSLSSDEGSIPVCKQYLWSKCRHKNCKYLHINVAQLNGIQCQVPTPSLPIDDNSATMLGNQIRQNIGVNEQTISYARGCCDVGMKRSYPNSVYIDEIGVTEPRVDSVKVPVFDNGCYISRPERQKRTYEMLEEENMMLRERVSELKKRVDDLQVTNEFLLEQNAQLRIRDKNTAGMTTVTVPAVTITNTVPGPDQIQQTPTPQQMVNAAIRTVTASVATVPVSLATVTPVSLAAVSMAPVQIPPPVVTMAQQAAPPPNDPQQVPQPLPMSISAPTAPLVSFPIVSHPVMQAPPDLRH